MPARGVVLLACACTAVLASGCGSSAPPRRTTSTWATVPGPALAKPKLTAAVQKQRALVAHVDAVSDRVLAEGKVHIAAGAPSDAEVRKELEAARKHGAKLPTGESVAAFEAAAAQTEEPAPDAVTPIAPWNPREKPIASWIVPVLEWAVEHGWHGAVTSGYRTRYEQAQLNAAGLFSAPAGLSNHETTVYPGGAVDVTDPGLLIQLLKAYNGPRKLIGGVLGAVDPEHFSATGD